MSRSIVTALAIAAGLTAAAAQTPPRQAQPSHDLLTPTPTAAPAQPDVLKWMNHAIEDILSGNVPEGGTPQAHGK